MKWPWRFSLRARLSLVFGVAAGVLVAIGVLVVSAVLVHSVDSAVDTELTRRLADVSAAAVSRSNSVITADQFAQVIASDGSLLVDSSFGARGPVLSGSELTAALKAPRQVDRAVPGLSEHARLSSNPERAGGRDVVVVVGAPTDAVVDARARARLVLWVAAPLAAVLLGAAAWVLIGAVLRPVNRLAGEAARLSVAEPGRRLPVPAGDHEVAALARNLNALLDRVEDAMAAERQFLDDASHELRTPLTILRGEVELAQLALADHASGTDPAGREAAVRSLQVAQGEAERLSTMAEDLLVLARLDRGEERLRREAVNLRRLADGVVGRLATDRPRVKVAGDDVLVNVDRQRVEQVLTNLVKNAQTHALGRVTVGVRSLGSEGAELEVADDGPGFPERLLPGAFGRFRRADAARRRKAEGSSGLGLAIVAAVVAAHGGSVEAANGPPLGGAVVRVRLPIGA
jgi:signal transduction histidine kinase